MFIVCGVQRRCAKYGASPHLGNLHKNTNKFTFIGSHFGLILQSSPHREGFLYFFFYFAPLLHCCCCFCAIFVFVSFIFYFCENWSESEFQKSAQNSHSSVFGQRETQICPSLNHIIPPGKCVEKVGNKYLIPFFKFVISSFAFCFNYHSGYWIRVPKSGIIPKLSKHFDILKRLSPEQKLIISRMYICICIRLNESLCSCNWPEFCLKCTHGIPQYIPWL